MTEETERGAPAGESKQDNRSPEEGAHPRGKWANNMEFILSMAGEIIGFANVWRFPYLCYKNGGGVFFIPYLVFLFCCGIPVFFLETALGQYTSEGGVTAWRKICPMFQGVGVASQVIVVYLNIYYIVILAWAIFYLVNSFVSPLPWSTCENWWNTDSCHGRIGSFANPGLFRSNFNWTFLNNLSSYEYYDNFSLDSNLTYIINDSPEEEFWSNRVLRVSANASLGDVHWDLALCLLLAWVICYFCIWKGIKTTGKAVYFTVTFPYLIFFILFIRGVTLPGAAEGLRFYLVPNFSKLLDLQVWSDAGTQVIYSYAVCQGVLTALGSYNKYNNNCYRDCLALCCLNSATSIFVGFVVFSILGFMAHDLNLSVTDVVVSGPDLVFITFPKALSLLPGSSFWAVLFFLMILVLGLDNQFVCMESLATAITDLFPGHLRRPGGREILVLVIAVVCFLLGLPLITEGGIYLFHVVDMYGACATSLVIIACAETIAVAWIYGINLQMLFYSFAHFGADRFYDNIEDMIGYRPLPLFKYCWLFITPFICLLTLLYNMVQTRSNMFGYVSWGSVLSSLLIATPLLCIPTFVLITLCTNPTNMTTPSKDLRQIRPHKPALMLFSLVILKAQGPSRRSMDEGNEKTMEATSMV